MLFAEDDFAVGQTPATLAIQKMLQVFGETTAIATCRGERSKTQWPIWPSTTL